MSSVHFVPGIPMIAVAGNIAAGKSTLAEQLSIKLDLVRYDEPVDENPYLEDFYRDMGASLHFNMYFLASRSEQVLAAADAGRPAIFDRTLFEDRIFVELAEEDGITPADNAAVFYSLVGSLERLLPPPSLIIYLHAPAEQLLRRVRSRGRSFERGLALPYLERLQGKYSDWIAGYTKGPLIRIDTEAYDFRRPGPAVDSIVEQIRSTISL